MVPSDMRVGGPLPFSPDRRADDRAFDTPKSVTSRIPPREGCARLCPMDDIPLVRKREGARHILHDAERFTNPERWRRRKVTSSDSPST